MLSCFFLVSIRVESLSLSETMPFDVEGLEEVVLNLLLPLLLQSLSLENDLAVFLHLFAVYFILLLFNCLVCKDNCRTPLSIVFEFRCNHRLLAKAHNGAANPDVAIKR